MIHRSKPQGADYSKNMTNWWAPVPNKVSVSFFQKLERLNECLSSTVEASWSLGTLKWHNRGGYKCGEWKSVHGYYTGNLIAPSCEISINWAVLMLRFIGCESLRRTRCILIYGPLVKRWKGFPWLWPRLEHRQMKSMSNPTSSGGENKR